MNRKGEALPIEHDVADAGSDGEQAARARAADAGDASGDDGAQPQRADGTEHSDKGNRRNSDPGSDVSVEERVRRRVAELDGIEHQPLATHAERYDEIHAELQAALTEIDGESGG
jgi:hypothetical protein